MSPSFFGVKQRLFPFTLPFVSVVLVLSFGEVASRIYYWTKEGIPPHEWHRYIIGNLGPSTLDEYLGWRATENYQSARQETTGRGVRYSVELWQNVYGFRMFGDLSSTKPKVLVIGDSFTHAREVSDSRTYYAVLKKTLDIEVFAYGVEGYGTLQEYMILDKYVDLIRPDLVLWQYCPNDFVNNDPNLERQSIVHNNSRKRPYWIDGKVMYILPRESWTQLREFAWRYSRFLQFIFGRLDRLGAISIKETLETEIEHQGLNHEGFARSFQTTRDLMTLVRSRVGNIPIVAFNCQDVEPFTEALKAISLSQGIIFLKEVGKGVGLAKESGDDVLHSDMAHWSEAGHRIVGILLYKYLKDNITFAHTHFAVEDNKSQ